MSQLSYTPFIDGDQPLASGFNTRYLLAINLINSGLESDNLASSAVTAAKIGTAAVTTTKLSHPILGVQSSNIASATTTDMATATGNMVDITGTTTITGFGTVQAGARFFVRFTGILTLTHNATSLILPTGANITTAAADSAILESLGSGNWRVGFYQRKDGTPLSASGAGTTIQTVHTTYSSASSTSSTYPDITTIPQNTEGAEFFTASITPSNSSNRLRITVVFMGDMANNASIGVVALHQDSTANALKACLFNIGGGTALGTSCCFVHEMAAGTTSSTTFKVRAGGTTGDTYINRTSTGSSSNLGGVMGSSITIEETKV